MSWNLGVWNAGPGSAAPWEPAEVLDVLEWLDGHLHGSEGFTAAFPGGFHLDRSRPDPERPYLIVDVLSEVPAFTTEDLHSEAVSVQLMIVADDLPTVRRLRTLLARHATDGLDRIDQASLGDADAVVTAIRTGGTVGLDLQRNPDGGDCVTCTLDYVFLLSRDS